MYQILQISRDIQIQYWSLAHRKAMEPYVNKGGKWMYSDMFDFYFDYPHSMTPFKKVYEAKLHLGSKECGEDDGVIGIECCLWTERVTEPEQLEKRLFPRVLAVADRAWSGDGEYREFISRVKTAEKKLSSVVAFTPEVHWDPKGAARRDETASYLKELSVGVDKEMQKTVSKTSGFTPEFYLSMAKKFFKLRDIPLMLTKIMKK